MSIEKSQEAALAYARSTQPLDPEMGWRREDVQLAFICGYRARCEDERSMPPPTATAPLSALLAPDQISERITASTGIHLTGRTVWEKACRLGIANKIGRSMLISIDDIPLLLKQETKKDRREQLMAKRVVRTGNEALKMLHRARSQRAKQK
jgi:hypothetical protein